MDDPETANALSQALADGYRWVGEALLRHTGAGSTVPADHPNPSSCSKKLKCIISIGYPFL